MNTLFLLLLTSIFLLLAVSLIWSRWHWTVKALLIISTLFVGISANVVWFITQGYAHLAPLPDKFLLAHTMTREPNPRNQDPGAIYYLIIDTAGKQVVPRLYSRAYSERGQRDATELQKRIKDQNGPVWVEKTQDATGEDSSGEQSSIKSTLRGMAAGFGYYEDDARHGLVPMSSTPALKQ